MEENDRVCYNVYSRRNGFCLDRSAQPSQSFSFSRSLFNRSSQLARHTHGRGTQLSLCCTEPCTNTIGPPDTTSARTRAARRGTSCACCASARKRDPDRPSMVATSARWRKSTDGGRRRDTRRRGQARHDKREDGAAQSPQHSTTIQSSNVEIRFRARQHGRNK